MITNENWRANVPARDLEHWERVFTHYQETARKAEADGVTYRYIPWYKARGDRSLIGKRVTVAYWMGGGDTPWGCQHAHGYAFEFSPVINIGPDFLATERRGSEQMISYDTICVQEPINQP